jgi:hypothetical protein
MSLLDQLKDPKLLPYVLGGAGVAGLAGGALTAQTPQQRNETPGGRRMRILRNGLMSAAAGGGAVALGGIGANALGNALPKSDVDPVSSIPSSWITRLGIGGTTAGALNGKNLWGSETAHNQQTLAQLINRNARPGASPTDLPFPESTGIHGTVTNPTEISNLFNKHDLEGSAAIRQAQASEALDRIAGSATQRSRILHEAGLSTSMGKNTVKDWLGGAAHNIVGRNSTALGRGGLRNPLARTLIAGAGLAAPEIWDAGKAVFNGGSGAVQAIKDKISPPPDYSGINLGQ